MPTVATETTLTRTPARIVPAVAALALGFAIFVTAGFASPSALHNSTHDTRHSLGLPCH